MSDIYDHSNHVSSRDEQHTFDKQPEQDIRGYDAPASTNLAPYSPAFLVGQKVLRRGYHSARSAVMQQAQQRYGNRAVQRALQAPSPATANPTEAEEERDDASRAQPHTIWVQREASNTVPLEMLKKGKPVGGSAPDPKGTSQGAGDAIKEIAVPTAPGPNATPAEMMRYQRDLQKYNRMFEMYSKIMQNAHEMKKNLISNLPR